jgi:hypothetical protein
VKLAKDGKFECKAEDSNGTSFIVNVTQKDQQGSIEWKQQGKIFEPAKFASSLKEEKGVDADCGSKNVVAVKGSKVECKLAGKGTVTVNFTDDEGALTVDDKTEGDKKE